MTIGTYPVGAELPDWPHAFYDRDGAIIDMSTGWTFQVTIGADLDNPTVTKTSGIAGADGTLGYSVLTAWATTGELDQLTRGTYQVALRARRTSDSKDRIYLDGITIT